MQPIESGDALADAVVANHNHLKGVTLRGITITDRTFSHIRLQDSLLEDVTFSNVHFTRAIWDHCQLKNVSFEHCRFMGGGFHDCVLDGARLNDVHIRNFSLVRGTYVASEWRSIDVQAMQCLGSNLSGIAVKTSNLSNVQFQTCVLRDVNFANTAVDALRISGGSVDDLRFNDLSVNHLCIENADIDRLKIEACTGKALSLYKSRLRNSQMIGSTLPCSTFADADLHNVQLTDNTLSMSNFDHAILWDCQLDRSILIGARCRHLRAVNTSFAHVNVQDADFHAACLEACDLRESNFEHVRPVDHEHLAAESWTPAQENAL